MAVLRRRKAAASIEQSEMSGRRLPLRWGFITIIAVVVGTYSGTTAGIPAGIAAGLFAALAFHQILE